MISFLLQPDDAIVDGDGEQLIYRRKILKAMDFAHISQKLSNTFVLLKFLQSALIKNDLNNSHIILTFTLFKFKAAKRQLVMTSYRDVRYQIAQVLKSRLRCGSS